jgi:3-oxoacyl-[acyl-carrier protein] reductase
MDGRLAGKAALVTGASRGIGAAVARRIAAAGGHVAVNFAQNADAAADVVAAIKAAGGQAFAIKADASAVESITEMFGELDRRFGRRGDTPLP